MDRGLDVVPRAQPSDHLVLFQVLPPGPSALSA